MRRLLATTLLLLTGFAWLAPAAVATVTIPTPACCRAAGPHHCFAQSPLEVQLRGQSCPYRKPRLFSGSIAPHAAVSTVVPADPHPYLHEFYPELFISDGEQPHLERSPRRRPLK
jgi:hypothetical protein